MCSEAGASEQVKNLVVTVTAYCHEIRQLPNPLRLPAFTDQAHDSAGEKDNRQPRVWEIQDPSIASLFLDDRVGRG